MSGYFRNGVRILAELCPRVTRTLSQIDKNNQPLNLDSDPEKGIQRGYRPLLVTQSDWQNRKSESVIVVPGTSELKKTQMRTHIVIPMLKGLSKQTMFCCEQRGVVNVNQLEKYCCTLPPDIMKKITRACRLAERGAKIKCRKSKK